MITMVRSSPSSPKSPANRYPRIKPMPILINRTRLRGKAFTILGLKNIPNASNSKGMVNFPKWSKSLVRMPGMKYKKRSLGRGHHIPFEKCGSFKKSSQPAQWLLQEWSLPWSKYGENFTFKIWPLFKRILQCKN